MGEKNFPKDSKDKGLIFKIYEQLIYLNNNKKKTQSKNGQKT